jgi:hypothetical protein
MLKWMKWSELPFFIVLKIAFFMKITQVESNLLTHYKKVAQNVAEPLPTRRATK